MSAIEITPQLLLRAYAHGLFPMAESADDERLFWLDPQSRGIIPIDEGFHCPRSLRKTLRRTHYHFSVDMAFTEVVRACALPVPSRESTWINAQIVELFTALHEIGHAHSVECWAPPDEDSLTETSLVGGLYGVALGGVFFGESMFSRASDTSKMCLVHLVNIMRKQSFALLDAQFMTDHLRRFGGHEIDQTAYKTMLAEALNVTAAFPPAGPAPPLEPALR